MYLHSFLNLVSRPATWDIFRTNQSSWINKLINSSAKSRKYFQLGLIPNRSQDNLVSTTSLILPFLLIPNSITHVPILNAACQAIIQSIILFNHPSTDWPTVTVIGLVYPWPNQLPSTTPHTMRGGDDQPLTSYHKPPPHQNKSPPITFHTIICGENHWSTPHKPPTTPHPWHSER